VHLANGHDWVIRAPNAAAETPYVQSLLLNGARFDGTWLDWSAIAGGATFDFALGSSPNLDWGHDPAHAPPSFE
jgi:putative alpha-1,2-mannosidase